MLSETLTLPAQADTDQGRLPDAMPNCKIQPVVMIFDSKPRYARQKQPKKPRKPSTAASRKTFAFVNTSRPGKADEESRRLIKTHAMQDVLRRKSSDSPNSELEVKSPRSLCLSQDSPRSVKSSPRAPPSFFLTFPIQIEPYMLKLVHGYAGAMLPTESKVVDSAWFPLIMTDAALFHALVCTSALFGLHDMIVQRKHMLESIRLINDRLPGDGGTSDTTITAILFMSKAEYFQGNHVAWRVHMDGVKRIVELRGGIEMLPQLIQQKIYSTDLLGCMEIGAIPHFPTTNLQKPLSPLYPCHLPPLVLSLAETYIFDADLLALLSEIPMDNTTSLPTHETPSLQYRLLSLYSMHRHSSTVLVQTSCSQAQHAQSEVVQELLLIGSLLFLSLPHMCALSPIRPVDYAYLLNRLNSIFSPFFTQHTLLLQYPDFLLWLSFLGEYFSSTSIFSLSSREASPFRLRLRAVSAMLEITFWEQMNVALGAMWGIDPRYETLYRCLWEEAVISDRDGICYET